MVFRIPFYRELMLWSGCVDAGEFHHFLLLEAHVVFKRKTDSGVGVEFGELTLCVTRRRNRTNAYS